MKNKAKTVLRFLGCFVLCFLVIYLIVLFGGWRFFESGDPILIEIGVAFIFSIFFFTFNEVIISQNNKIMELEKRVKALEDSAC